MQTYQQPMKNLKVVSKKKYQSRNKGAARLFHTSWAEIKKAQKKQPTNPLDLVVARATNQRSTRAESHQNNTLRVFTTVTWMAMLFFRRVHAKGHFPWANIYPSSPRNTLHLRQTITLGNGWWSDSSHFSVPCRSIVSAMMMKIPVVEDITAPQNHFICQNTLMRAPTWVELFRVSRPAEVAEALTSGT